MVRISRYTTVFDPSTWPESLARLPSDPRWRWSWLDSARAEPFPRPDIVAETTVWSCRAHRGHATKQETANNWQRKRNLTLAATNIIVRLHVVGWPSVALLASLRMVTSDLHGRCRQYPWVAGE